MERRPVVVAPGGRAWSALFRRARRRTAADLARDGRWLVLAPHPDDETLGVGGLVAALAAAGAPPLVAFVTDGAGSHVGAPGWPPARIARLRAAEARAALRMLDVAEPPILLGWRDASPPAPGDPAFRKALATLASWCRRARVRHLAVTWDGDPHCDHQAAAVLAGALARATGATLHHYPVWGWTRTDAAAAIGAARAVSIDTAAHRPAQRRALACHRSQRGGRIAGGESFRLPRFMLRLVDRPATLLLEARYAA